MSPQCINGVWLYWFRVTPVYRQIPLIRTLEHVRINGVSVPIKRVEFRDVTAFPRDKENCP